MVELNAAGWAAVLGPGLVAGLVVGRASGRRLAATLTGAVAAWALALLVDGMRWRQSDISFDITDVTETDWRAAHEHLVRRGIDYRVDHQRVDAGPERRHLHVQMRHHREVLEILHPRA